MQGTMRSLHPTQFHICRWRALAASQPSQVTRLCCSTQHEAPVVWPGLAEWRASQVDARRHWGPKGPQLLPPNPGPPSQAALDPLPSLAAYGRRVLLTADPYLKAALTHAAWASYRAGTLPVGSAAAPDAPARPDRPLLVPARAVPTLQQSGLPMNVHTLHTLAHIELNAVDLAWDTVVRFSPLRLPEQFYADFARVADDESRHLSWCLQRLEQLGSHYGCMPAHDLLWQGCRASAGDVRTRLAVVPMSQEARGLDAGHRMAARLVGWGDNCSAKLVARISDEERAHVAVGVAWFGAVCGAQGVDPGEAFVKDVAACCPDLLSGIFNHEARQEVGLPREWYDSTAWAEDMRAAAASVKAAGEEAAAGGGAGGSGVALEELRRRLEAVVAAEAQACG